jgi:hypothetical protein
MGVRLSLFVVATGLLAACSGASSTVDGGSGSDAAAVSCAARSGVYKYEESLTWGNCGPANPPQAFNIGDANQSVYAIPFAVGEKTGAGNTATVATYFPNCSGSVSVSTSNCTIEYSVECSFKDGTGGTMRKVGKATWSADGLSAKGSESFTAFDSVGNATCSGEYGAVLSK